MNDQIIQLKINLKQSSTSKGKSLFTASYGSNLGGSRVWDPVQLHCTYQVRSDSKHQREWVLHGLQSTGHRGTPGLMHFPASWNPTDGKLWKTNISIRGATKRNLRFLLSLQTNDSKVVMGGSRIFDLIESFLVNFHIFCMPFLNLIKHKYWPFNNFYAHRLFLTFWDNNKFTFTLMHLTGFYPKRLTE